MDISLNYVLIGVRLRAIRLKRGYTQEYVAECAEISAQHCCGIECGKAKVSLPALIRLCNALEITPNDVLMDSVENSAPQLLNEVATVFDGCAPDEMYLMLSQAENLKMALKLKKIRLARE
jgi:transcriptional regulator with XRE-family HTH domain